MKRIKRVYHKANATARDARDALACHRANYLCIGLAYTAELAGLIDKGMLAQINMLLYLKMSAE